MTGHVRGIRLSIERLDWRLAPLGAALVDKLGVRLLDVARVLQHHIRQVGGGLRHVDRPIEAAPHQVGQVARVVDVRVRQDDRIHGARIEREVQVSGVGLLPSPLIQPTVQKES